MIVVNTTFRLAPWADALYAMDRKWWDVHIDEVRRKFKGELTSIQWRCHGVKKVTGLNPPRNSGAGAIALAARYGARRVLLLGYDCQHTGGERHWHGDHPPGTAGNAAPKTVAKWPQQFRELKSRLRGIEVINATRETALDVFPRAELEQVLA